MFDQIDSIFRECIHAAAVLGKTVAVRPITSGIGQRAFPDGV
jgi:hypothetical protein